ncbi:MAG: kynureninase [Fidelibacterota bacterium]|nr:MAG: kynureninase [Candidatus Neomarinimicrobiota bacterium]
MTSDEARALDRHDTLAPFRDRFVVDQPGLIYLNGNSLGRLPKATAERMREVVEQEWGCDLIRGWNRSWYEAAVRIGEKVAQLVGAAPGQVILSDSTSVNLFKLVLAALELRPDRNRIVSDTLNFPSDLYVLQSCVRLLGGRHHIHLVPSEDDISISLEALHDEIDEQTALVTLSHVAFKTGFCHDAAAITERAHEVGALVLWDLSHSVGVVPTELDRWGADMAVGCTYKYLCGGPGAPAFLYVRRELQERVLSPVWGWFGQQAPFEFDLTYQPAEGIRRFLVGTSPILSLLALEPALDLVLEAGVQAIRAKSVRLTSMLVDLMDEVLVPLGFALGSPRDPDRRGSHVSILHPEAYRINRALIEEMNVLADFREPNLLRFGLAPVYTSFTDVWQAVDCIRQVVETGHYRSYSPQRQPVT